MSNSYIKRNKNIKHLIGNRVHCADSDSRIVNLSALLNVPINFHLKKCIVAPQKKSKKLSSVPNLRIISTNV